MICAGPSKNKCNLHLVCLRSLQTNIQGAHSPDARSVAMGVYPVQSIKSQIVESSDVSERTRFCYRLETFQMLWFSIYEFIILESNYCKAFVKSYLFWRLLYRKPSLLTCFCTFIGFLFDFYSFLTVTNPYCIYLAFNCLLSYLFTTLHNLSKIEIY